MNQIGFLNPKIKTGFDLIRLVSVRLTLWIQLYTIPSSLIVIITNQVISSIHFENISKQF